MTFRFFGTIFFCACRSMRRPTYPPDARAFIRNFFFKGQFNQIFDLIEFFYV